MRRQAEIRYGHVRAVVSLVSQIVVGSGKLSRGKPEMTPPSTAQQLPIALASPTSHSEMANELRERKKGTTEKSSPAEKAEEPVDLEPNMWVVLGIILVFAALLSVFFYYKVDGRDNGPFYRFVNENFLPKNRYQKKG